MLLLPLELMLEFLVLDSDVNQLISSSNDIEMSNLPFLNSLSTFSTYIGTVWPYNFVLRRVRRGCTSAMVGRAAGDLSMHMEAKLRRSRKTSSGSVIDACCRAEVSPEVLAFASRGENWKWRIERVGNSGRGLKVVSYGMGC